MNTKSEQELIKAMMYTEMNIVQLTTGGYSITDRSQHHREDAEKYRRITNNENDILDRTSDSKDKVITLGTKTMSVQLFNIWLKEILETQGRGSKSPNSKPTRAGFKSGGSKLEGVLEKFRCCSAVPRVLGDSRYPETKLFDVLLGRKYS